MSAKHIIQNERQINSEHYDYSPAWGDINHNKLFLFLLEMALTGTVLTLGQEIVSWTYGLQLETIMANGANLSYYLTLLILKTTKVLRFYHHRVKKFILLDVQE